MKKGMIRVWTITCPSCKVEIYSRAHHDFCYCKCGDIAVDGGFSYVRYLAKDLEMTRKSFRYRFVKATKKELYDDWNQRINKFGVIK
jgi:hypothetical protein